MTNTQLALFDYNGVVGRDVKACESAANRIRKRERRMCLDVVSIGEELLVVKERLPHGMFGKWLDHHFGWTDRAARMFIGAAEVFGKTENFSELTIDQSAMYLLSADSCPEDATNEAIKRAKKGERITHKVAKDIRAKHTQCDSDDGCQECAAEPSEFDIDDFMDSQLETIKEAWSLCPKELRKTFKPYLLQTIDKVFE